MGETGQAGDGAHPRDRLKRDLRASDATFLVVRIGKTPRDLLKAALESMEGKKIVGLLLNGVEKQMSGYSYYGYYSKYHQRPKG